MDEQSNEQIWKMFIFVLALLSSIAISLATWTALEVVNNGKIISSINSSRCTSADCSSIRESISDLRAQISILPKEIPPKWFLDKVNQIDLRTSNDISTLEKRMEQIERMLLSHEKGSSVK